jgi:alkanesulfonate monooxygenase SsuD/methylene tetrahydromethanopterin reductase-like flavin-dependent oxidoreductase (luciferase family)
MKVGVILPIGEEIGEGEPLPYAAVRAMALQAEEAGFDSIWVPDHLLFRLPGQEPFGIWESWTILTGLAEATTRVELGPLVMCVPFRNPALLAKMAVTIDEVSGGRFILGLGAGWHQPEFEAFGVPFDHLADQFEEGIQIIAPLLREGWVDFHGEHFSAPDGELRPRGPRPGGPPILVAARGPRMMRLTAQYADQWNAAWSGRPTLFHQRYAALVDACNEAGRDPATIGITVGLYILYPEHLKPAEAEMMPDSYYDLDKALRGTPDEIAAGLGEYTTLGVDHLICELIPSTPATLAEFAQALRLLRG